MIKTHAKLSSIKNDIYLRNIISTNLLDNYQHRVDNNKLSVISFIDKQMYNKEPVVCTLLSREDMPEYMKIVIPYTSNEPVKNEDNKENTVEIVAVKTHIRTLKRNLKIYTNINEMNTPVWDNREKPIHSEYTSTDDPMPHTNPMIGTANNKKTLIIRPSGHLPLALVILSELENIRSTGYKVSEIHQHSQHNLSCIYDLLATMEQAAGARVTAQKTKSVMWFMQEHKDPKLNNDKNYWLMEVPCGDLDQQISILRNIIYKDTNIIKKDITKGIHYIMSSLKLQASNVNCESVVSSIIKEVDTIKSLYDSNTISDIILEIEPPIRIIYPVRNIKRSQISQCNYFDIINSAFIQLDRLQPDNKRTKQSPPSYHTLDSIVAALYYDYHSNFMPYDRDELIKVPRSFSNLCLNMSKLILNRWPKIEPRIMGIPRDQSLIKVKSNRYDFDVFNSWRKVFDKVARRANE